MWRHNHSNSLAVVIEVKDMENAFVKCYHQYMCLFHPCYISKKMQIIWLPV